MSPSLAGRALAVLAACALHQTGDAFAADAVIPVATEVPAGTYQLDPAHASLISRGSHLGFSRYTARFTRFEAELQLGPADPAAATVTATKDPSSIETGNRDPSYDFDAQLRGEPWLDTARFPQMTFRPTEVELTGALGARIGFSAHGTLIRSSFGIAEGVPPPGSDFGVGDPVEILIEAEFTRGATG